MRRNSSKYFWLLRPSTGTVDDRNRVDYSYISGFYCLVTSSTVPAVCLFDDSHVLTDAEEEQGLHAEELLPRDLQQQELLWQMSHPYAVLVHGGNVHSMSADVTMWNNRNIQVTRVKEQIVSHLGHLFWKDRMSEIISISINGVMGTVTVIYLYNKRESTLWALTSIMRCSKPTIVIH